MFSNSQSTSTPSESEQLVRVDAVEIRVPVYDVDQHIARLYAEGRYKEVIESRGNTASLQYQFLQGMSLFRLGLYGRCVPVFEKLLGRNHHMREYLLWKLIQALYAQKEWRAALSYLKEFREKYYGSPLVFESLKIEVELRVALKEYGEILSGFEGYASYIKGANTAGDHKEKVVAQVMYYRAYASELLGSTSKAVVLYLEALAYPDLRGTVYSRLTALKTEYLSLLSYEHKVALAFFLASKRKQYDEALKLLLPLRWQSLDTTEVLKLRTLAFAYKHLKMDKEEAQVYEDFFNTFTDPLSYSYQHAQYLYVSYLYSSNKPKAEEVFHQILSHPNHHFLKKSLSEFHNRMHSGLSDSLLVAFMLQCIRVEEYRFIDAVLFDLITKKHYSRVLGILESLLSQTPNTWIKPKLYYWKGRIFEVLQRTSDARDLYKKGFLVYKRTYYTYLCLSRLKHLLQSLDEKTQTRELLELYTQDADALSQLVRSQPFKERVSTLKLQYDFTQNPLFQKAFQLMSFGEVADGYQSFLRFVESLENNGESRSQYFLLFVKLFHDMRLPQFSISYADFLMGYLNGPFSPNYVLKSLAEYSYPVLFQDKIFAEAARCKVDPYLVLAIIREESRFYPAATSRSGAMGLMQLMKDTAEYLLRKKKTNRFVNKDFYKEDLNIFLGTEYIAQLLSQMSLELSVGSYNGGPTRLKRIYTQLQKERTLLGDDHFVELLDITETRRYIKKVLLSYFYYKEIANA